MKLKDPAVVASDFESRIVYHSKQTPGYTSWVSFFPGELGRWYLSCEEVTRPEKPLPKMSRERWYEVAMPVGYDKSQYLMEAVILESDDGMRTWREVSREPYHYHHSIFQYATARTRDGRFLRFVSAWHSLDETVRANEIFYESSDNGKTWRKMPPFHHDHFFSYPHRMRTLRDGTLVLALPLSPAFGRGTDRPVRTARNLDAIGEMSMTLWFSYDDGRSWSGPLPIYGGQVVSETDFVELSDGNLMCINNSIFANPGRQIIYREGTRWTPGPLERSRGQTKWGDANQVPETVAMSKGGVLVGCMRAGAYSWSDDLGLNWQRLEGIPEMGPEVYQPWIHCLGGNRFVCAGHYGADDAIGRKDQHLTLHSFNVEVRRKTRNTRLEVSREYDEAKERWVNVYPVRLLCDGEPLSGKEIEFWYVEMHKPGYDSWNKTPLEERIKMGGTSLRAVTDADGIARISLSEYDALEDIRPTIQFVVRFNTDGRYPEYKPVQSLQFEFRLFHCQDPPL